MSAVPLKGIADIGGCRRVPGRDIGSLANGEQVVKPSHYVLTDPRELGILVKSWFVRD
jgi:hypothetical protein